MSPALTAEVRYLRDLARGFGGALLFSVPLLMTMEMWWFGFDMDRGRLALFLLLSLPLLYGLSYFAGFRKGSSILDNLLDTLAALAVGYLLAAVLLGLFGVLDPGASLTETVGKLSLQAVPAAIGALVARHQLSGSDDADEIEDGDDAGEYFAELFLMVVGALYVAFNVAPTEEIVLIAFMMAPWQTLALALLSIFLLHAVVYSVGFAGQEEHDRPVTAFFHFTVAGYALTLMVALYVLWTFGRTDGQSWEEVVSIAVVLGFPGAIGAAAARLLV